jgi:hypothetical protein
MGARKSSIGVVVVASIIGTAAYAQTQPAKNGRALNDASYSSRLTARPATAGPEQDEAPVEIRLMSPAAVRSVVRVAPHADNRTLRIVMDSANYYRSSDVQLDGDRAAQSHFFTWADLPPGSYSVVVTVLGPNGPRAAKMLPFDVVEPSVGLVR